MQATSTASDIPEGAERRHAQLDREAPHYILALLDPQRGDAERAAALQRNELMDVAAEVVRIDQRRRDVHFDAGLPARGRDRSGMNDLYVAMIGRVLADDDDAFLGYNVARTVPLSTYLLFFKTADELFAYVEGVPAWDLAATYASNLGVQFDSGPQDEEELAAP